MDKNGCCTNFSSRAATSEVEVDQDNTTDVLFESCYENVKACEAYIPEIDKSLFKNSTSFFFIHLNIASFQAHFDELIEFLSNFSTSPTIIFLSETRINVTQSTNINIPNYTFTHFPSPTIVGGVEAYISNELNCSLNNDLRLNVPMCEDLWLDVDFSSHNLKYTFAIIYRHPCNNHSTFFEALDEKLQIINNRRSTAMVMGNFNIDLSGDNNRSPLADYLQILQSNAFVSIVNLPTRITPTSQTIIDHIVTKVSVSVITPGIFTYQIFDHRPIFCTLTDTKLKTSGMKASYTLRNISSLDRQNFLNDLNDALSPITHNFTLLTPDNQYNNFDAYFTKLITALSEIIDQHAPLPENKNACNVHLG